jgi:Kdo2-lipid IVA lauroyltransferase/acyltransferase
VSETKDPTAKKFPWTVDQVHDYLVERNRDVELKGQRAKRIVFGLFIGMVKSLSWKNADRLGAWLGKLAALFAVRKSIAMTNLDIAFGDRKTKVEKEKIYRDSMIVLGRHVLDYMRVDLMDAAFWESFEIENEQILRDAYNRGKGVIFVGGHIGIWEIAAGRVGMAGYPISIVAKRLKDPFSDKFIVDARLKMNLGTVAHLNSMDRVREGIERGEGIIMAVDQNMKRSQGVFVEWMGRTASTVRSNAWVARETGAPVVCGHAYRVAPGKFKLVISEEIPWEPHPEDPDAELLINTRNQVRAVEKVIYEQPEQWLWIHRRWKVQPEGVESPYKK